MFTPTPSMKSPSQGLCSSDSLILEEGIFMASFKPSNEGAVKFFLPLSGIRIEGVPVAAPCIGRSRRVKMQIGFEKAGTVIHREDGLKCV